ncbi:MAG: vWA domain-containing protein [Planctomycetota bacterium]|jgi:Mg-chelatase subunit ChlD
MGAPAADPLNLFVESLPHVREVRFDMPGRAWLAVPAIAVLLIAPILRRRRLGGAVWPGVLRAAALGAILAVLCEPFYIERGEQPGAVVVVADVSPSVGDRGVEQMRGMLPGGEVVAFGAEPKAAAKLEPDPAPATDIAAALRFAAARAGATQPLRLLLLSDGRATHGAADEVAMRLRHRDVEIAAVGVPDRTPPAPPAIHLAHLRAREVEEPGRVPTLVAQAVAEAATTAEAILFVDGKEVGRESIALRAGPNDMVLPELKLPPGRYHAQLLLLGDNSPDDNLGSTELRVEGAPKVLVLAAAERKSLIAEALKKQGMEVSVKAADAALDGFDAVILLPDADARVLDERSGDLAAFVGKKGGGLLAVGGGEGPGLARLAESATAFLLPVEVESREAQPEKPAPPEKEQDPQPKIEIKEEKTQAYPITLCLVVDRSGSMAGEKIQRAKIAAGSAADALTDEDRIAVIAFGDEAILALPPQPGGDARPVVRTLAPLPASGRTAMFAALRGAYALMDKEESPIRHIVLISDGVPTDSGRWRDLVLAGRAKKITLSCVGIGFEIDRRHLGRLASWGHGKLWSVVHAHEIPQVVTQDTVRVVRTRNERGKDAERNAPRKKEPEKKPEEKEPEKKPEETEPKPESEPLKGVTVKLEAAAPRGMFKGIEKDKLPEVASVEQGKPRFASWVGAQADDKPLLVYRRVGLGTSGALMVDPESRGGRALREHPEFARMMGQLIRSVLPDRPADTLQITTRLVDEGKRLVLQVFGEDGRPRTDLPLELTIGDAARPTLRRSDRYEAELAFRARTEVVRVRVGEPPLLERAFALPPSRDPEMGSLGVDEAALRRIAGGPLTTDVAAALSPPVAPTSNRRPLWLPFLALAAILLPIDAWARRRARSASPSRRATRTA